MTAAVLPLLLSLASGYLLARLCCRGLPLALHLAAGAGLGIGLGSLVTFAMLVSGRLSRGSMIVADAALLALLAVAVVTKERRPCVMAPRPKADGSPLVRAAWAVFALCLVCAVAAWFRTDYPHGEWDAWALWNLRARFMFRGLDHWRDAFSPLLASAHPDYPLLAPAAVLRSWLYAGSELTAAPREIGFVFTFAAAGVLAAGVGLLRGAAQGAIAGSVLLATNLFVTQGALQYADVPLSFFILSALVFLAAGGERPGCYLLAGIAAGCAAWTKNEGVVFLAAAVAVFAISRWMSSGFRPASRAMAAVLAGALPFAAAVAFLKLRIAPVSDVFLTQGALAAWSHLADTGRYGIIARSLWAGLAELRVGGLHPLILPLLYLAFVGFSKDRARALSGMVVLLLMAASYALAYAATPNDLAWHIRTSVHRLLLQIWPAFLFVVFLLAREP